MKKLRGYFICAVALILFICAIQIQGYSAALSQKKHLKITELSKSTNLPVDESPMCDVDDDDDDDDKAADLFYNFLPGFSTCYINTSDCFNKAHVKKTRCNRKKIGQISFADLGMGRCEYQKLFAKAKMLFCCFARKSKLFHCDPTKKPFTS